MAELSVNVPRRRAVPAPWLALLAGPLSFGITGPSLVLSDVAGSLSVSLAAAASLVTAFGWGIAVGTPLMGVLLARRGTAVALGVGAVLVAAGAVSVLTVPGLAALVVGSGLQALGTAGLTVVAMSLAGSAGAMGMVTAALASFGAVAPLIGARVSAAVSWQATLALPLLSLLALPAVWLGAGGRGGGGGGGAVAGRGDPVGAALLVGLVTALVFLPSRPLVAGVVAVAAAVSLVWHARRRRDGFVPASVLASPKFLASSGIALLVAVVNFGVVYAVPGVIASLTGWGSGQLGVAMLVPYLSGGAISWFLVTLSARLGYLVLVGTLVAGAVVAAGAVAVGGSLPTVFAGMVIGSLSASTGQGALALRAAASVPERVRPTAIGLFNLCYLLGAAFGPAIAAAGA
ncbi:MFS transporter [Pseudonocardia acaciae]|uniref:MFS transporter n=1 Tax=Pseudonocardia acaciae TaxID=551276 RepID=UPI0004908DB6|nr:MFS transporter [Pseudonocardia acaciae]